MSIEIEILYMYMCICIDRSIDNSSILRVLNYKMINGLFHMLLTCVFAGDQRINMCVCGGGGAKVSIHCVWLGEGSGSTKELMQVYVEGGGTNEGINTCGRRGRG